MTEKRDMDYTGIIQRLIGPIEPVGESHTDEARLDNLKAMCAMVNDLVSAIDDVSYRNLDRVEYSMKQAGQYAHDFLTKTLGIADAMIEERSRTNV